MKPLYKIWFKQTHKQMSIAYSGLRDGPESHLYFARYLQQKTPCHTGGDDQPLLVPSDLVASIMQKHHNTLFTFKATM
jgi:hypothetical protein